MTLVATPRRILAGILGAAALLYTGYHLGLMTRLEETGILETPLLCSILVQWQRGPESLYGPYGGDDPFVLIHAPLYYRLAAGIGWPGVRLGFPPITMALAVGRGLALLGMLTGLVAVYRLATIDGASPRAGILAVLLMAASPILVILGVMVRPDALAYGIQMAGVGLILRGLQRPDRARASWVAAYACFGLSLCVKQHCVVTPAISSLLLAAAWLRQRATLRPILFAQAVGATLVIGYFAAEDIVTGGLTSRSVIVLPGGPFRAINHASWAHVGSVCWIAAKKSVGLLALAGCGLGLLRRSFWERPLDRILATYGLAEALSVIPLSLNNAGAADNYALQAVTFGAILVGRALDRLLAETPLPARRWGPVALAALVLLANDVRLVEQTARLRRQDAANVRAILDHPAMAGLQPSQRYFVGMGFQHLNRLYGRFDITHDEWLYGAFENVHAAEPRSRWLRSALRQEVRAVVQSEPTAAIPGLAEPLPELGFIPVGQAGRYRLWIRSPEPAPGLARRGP